MCKNFPFCNALVSLAPVVRMDICSHLFLEYISHLNIFTRKKFVKFSKSANLTKEVAIDNWGSRKAASALPWHGMAWHGMPLWQDMAWQGTLAGLSKIYWSSHTKTLHSNQSMVRPESQVFVQDCKVLLTHTYRYSGWYINIIFISVKTEILLIREWEGAGRLQRIELCPPDNFCQWIRIMTIIIFVMIVNIKIMIMIIRTMLTCLS